MEVKKGSLSISSENIFPIIKKWVYSDHDIFVREMISNGCDAITKLKKLDVMGEYQLPDDYKASIHVEVNPEEKTLKFIDNGLGMTAEEVEEYSTQIAFSEATEFLEKYKDKGFYEEHPTILFRTIWGNEQYQILSAFTTPVYTGNDFNYYSFIKAQKGADYEYFIREIKRKAIYETGITAEYGDKLLTLSTCEYSQRNGRMVVVAKKIQQNESRERTGRI